MTVVFVDPAGPLPGSSETIEFTSDRTVLAVSLEYDPAAGNGSWETVYQDGRFAYKYRNSSVAGSSWVIRPPADGGRWLRPFRVVVDAPEPGVAGWNLLYQVDFSALANQSYTTPGAITIDGKTWYAKGLESPGGGDLYARRLVNGKGLGLMHLNSTSGGAPSIGTSGDLNYPHFFMPLAQVNPTGARVLVRARFVWDVAATGQPYVGIANGTLDGTGQRTAHRASEHLVGPSAVAGTTAGLSYKPGAGSPSSSVGRSAAMANSVAVTGVMQFASVYEHFGNEAYTTGMPPTIDTFLPSPGNGGLDGTFTAPTRANPGVLFSWTGPLSIHAVYLQQLQIMGLGVL